MNGQTTRAELPVAPVTLQPVRSQYHLVDGVADQELVRQR